MKKVFLFTVIFFLGAFLFGIIIKKIEFGKIKSITFEGSKIQDFVLVNKNSNKTYFVGEKAIETEKYFIISNLSGYIEKSNRKTYISSEKANLNKKENLAKLYKNVKITMNSTNLLTTELTINLKKQIAYGNDLCKITTGKSLTTGKNIFINLKREILKLENVKTIIER